MGKLGLVLEGGGMRGAYTAGCLAWMIENKIVTDYGKYFTCWEYQTT